jgi:hypothetical protein
MSEAHGLDEKAYQSKHLVDVYSHAAGADPGTPSHQQAMRSLYDEVAFQQARNISSQEFNPPRLHHLQIRAL